MNIIKLTNSGVETISRKVLEEGPYKDEQHLDSHMKHKDQIDLSFIINRPKNYIEFYCNEFIDIATIEWVQTTLGLNV